MFLPGVLSQEWLDLIQIGFQRNMRTPGPFALDAFYRPAVDRA